MNETWKSVKVLAFVLTLSAFVYVGYIISQKGRYQPIPNPNPGGAFTVIDTQT